MRLSERFIKQNLLRKDLETLESIPLKSILIIGGAGTIGSNYIKQILNFKPSKIFVVDTNENE